MAKDLNRSIKIYIDHSDAMSKAKDFENRISKVNEKLKDLNAQGKKDSAEYTKTEGELKKLTSSYDRYHAKVQQTERILKNLSGATRGELEQLQKELKKSLKDVARGTDEYNAKVQALIAVEKQLNIVKKEQNGTMGKNATLWSSMANGFNKYFGIVTSIVAGITGLSFTLRKLSEDVAKMDDVYSDVMKTTGMTRNEVLDLNETFKKMDTRTARDELNNLARDAGKLGLEGKKDILDFVEAGNQINVSLGEDLGEGAIKNIGKMTDVYAQSTKQLEQMDLKGKMLAIGSAINELGASSTASEAYMVSFTQRLGGVASQAGISIQNILGYASALDQSGQAVEMSATALQKFIMSLMGNPAKFAKIAGLEVKAFNKLLKEDTNEAIKQVLTALSQKGGFQQLIPIFKEMGLDGARAVGVLSALATNIEKVNTAQEISNKAFTEGTSITNEYAIKNNNLNAKLEKARKAFSDASLELGESLNPVLLTSTKWTTYLIKNLPTLLNFFEKYGKYLLYLTVVYGLYIAGVKVAAAIETIYNGILAIGRLRRIQIALATTESAAAQTLYNNVLQNGSIVTRGYTAVTSLLSAAKFLLTGNLVKARQAMLSFNAATSMNPAGIAAALVLALVAAIGYLVYKSNQVMTATKAIAKATEEFSGELAKEQSEVNQLFEAYKRTNPESEEHRKIKDQIIKLYGPYLKGLIDEEGNLTNVAKAQEIVNSKIRESISLKIKNAATETIQTDGIKNQMKEVDEIVSMLQKQLGSSFSTEAANVVRENIHKAIDKSIAEGKTGMVELTEAIKEVVDKESTDMKEKFGFWDPKSIVFQVQSISSAVYNTQRQVQKVNDQFKGLVSDATTISNIIGDDANDNDYTAPVDEEELKKQVQMQKKELDLILENLETKHQEKLLEIKKKYANGKIDSESEFNSKLFSQEQAYYLLQENALENYLKKVSDKTLRSDISKQLAEIRNKQLDESIKFQKKLEKIILDANPEEKEKQAYADRLRDLSLFGKTKEVLLLEIAAAETEEEKQALQKKYEAFVLLEQQHMDNLVKIRKDGKAKKKAGAEEEFEEEFAGRKAQLLQEIADDEQKISVDIGLGALTGDGAFNAEVELQRKRIALLQEEVAARQKAGLDTSKVLQRYRSEELSLTKLYVAEYKRRSQLSNQYGDSLGSALGNVLIGHEGALRDFGNVVLDILFDTLSSIINAKIAEATAVAIAEQAKAAAISAAQPDSVVTFGASAIARTAAIGAIIMGALAVAKTALKGLLGKRGSSGSNPSGGSNTTNQRVVTQNADGKYDVIGEQDGKLYKNVPYTGQAQTGLVLQPTLVGEEGTELVVSAPHLRSLQKHMNYPLIVEAIQDVRYGRTPQRASGKYDEIENYHNTNQPQSSGITLELFQEMISVMKEVRDKDIDINYYKFEKVQKTVTTARNLAKRK